MRVNFDLLNRRYLPNWNFTEGEMERFRKLLRPNACRQPDRQPKSTAARA